MFCVQRHLLTARRVFIIEVTIRPVTGTMGLGYISGYRNYSHSAIHPVERKRELTYSFFLSVMPTKDLAPFSYISPQKTLFSTINYELTTEFLSANW